MRVPCGIIEASFAALVRVSSQGRPCRALGLAPSRNPLRRWTAEPGIAIQQRNSEASSGAGRRGIHTNASASMSAPVTRGVAVDPTALAPPFARYSHGCEVSFAAPNTRMVFVSGQLGVKPDGTCSEDAYTQATQCLKNVLAVLDGAGMGVANVVRLNAYVTHREHLKDYMRARDELLESAEWPNGPPASTLMIVSGFARPEFKVEVEATAAA